LELSTGGELRVNLIESLELRVDTNSNEMITIIIVEMIAAHFALELFNTTPVSFSLNQEPGEF